MERILPAASTHSGTTMARREPTIAVVCLLLLGFAVAAGPPIGDAQVSAPAEGPATWIKVNVDATGDADWTIESRFDVSTADRREAFEGLVDRVRAGADETPYDRSLIEAYRDAAATHVDREMAIEDVRWEDRIEDDVGILVFRFTWTNFAADTGDRLEVGDAFRSPDGTWLETLGPDTWLTITGPEDYPVVSAPPDQNVEDGAVTWEGPTTFEPGDFAVAYEVPSVGSELDVGTALMLAIAWLGIGLVLLATYRRSRESEADRAPATEGDDEPSAEGGGEGSERIDVELLSDPERVERLLEEHGGRMKQAAIVEETDWSTAKVSQLLSDMAEEERVEKLRIGQENLISLPDEDQ